MSIRESAATSHSGLCIICTSRLKVSAKKTSGVRSAIGSASLQKAAKRVA